jgi:hypothetical protein
MKSFTFQLPVKRYVRKYLLTKYGEFGVVPAKMESDVGFVILNTLASSLDGKVCRGYNAVEWKQNPEMITFEIPFHYFYLVKKEISPETCVLLNRFFENKFEMELCEYVDMVNQAGKLRRTVVEDFADQKGLDKNSSLKRYLNGAEFTRKKAIEDFIRQYNVDIEVDVSYDALKQMEIRYRKKNQELFLRRLSLPHFERTRTCA